MASGKMIGKGYGVLSVASDYDFDTSEKNLKKVIMSQGDTLWFGELDYQALAQEQGVDIPRCTVMFFGGPKPGGVAMKEFPKLGLDAFCQKILLLEGPSGKVTLYYNSITALSEFHYGKASKVHQQLDQRITATYNMALISSKNE